MTTASRGFREPSYFVLASLLDGSRHGYGIIKQAAVLSGGEVRLAPGTLYGALDRLAAAGLIEPSGQEVVAGRPRHYYQLTADGRTSLMQEARRLAFASRAVLDRAEGSDEAAGDARDGTDIKVIVDLVERTSDSASDYRSDDGSVASADSVSTAQPSSSSMFVLNGSAPRST